jgi:hypothetical protein
MTTTILAGNVAHIDRTFTRAAPGSITGSTATVAVTDPTGASAEVSAVTITINDTAGTLRVVADWEIRDIAGAGYYTVTIDIAGGMVAAWQDRVYVRARTLAVVP